MKEIGKKVWEEPAVAIGLLVSIVLLIGAIIEGTDWEWDNILVILSPFLTGLGIRPFVRPDTGQEDAPKPPPVAV
jgi:hypothetical protein